MIAIINYGVGNLASILNMCKRVGAEAMITSNTEEISKATKLLLPGVGHFQKGMETLNSSGLKEVVDHLVLVEKKPVLGICLGAQLMTRSSEESNIPGLGWIDATTIKFQENKIGTLKVPHMGWNNVSAVIESALFKNFKKAPRFYFAHSYHFMFEDAKQVIATAMYGYTFPCAFQKENIWGTQFHPEKSHKYGMQLIQNFNLL